MHKQTFAILIFWIVATSLQAQNAIIDSLKKTLLTARDTHRVNALNALAGQLVPVKPDSSLYFAGQAEALSGKLGFNRGYIVSLICSGKALRAKSDYRNALKYFDTAIEFAEKIKSKEHIASILNQTGLVYYAQGNYQDALNYYFRSLKLAEELNDGSQIAICLGNIGSAYDDLEQLDKALDHYLKALAMTKQNADMMLMAKLQNSIGVIYRKQGKYEQALKYFFGALEAVERTGDKFSVSIRLTNIGNVYTDLKDFSTSLSYYAKAIKLAEEIGDLEGVAINLSNSAFSYTSLQQYEKAEESYHKALSIAREIGATMLIHDNYEGLANLYKESGDYKKALEYHQLYAQYKDSVLNETSAEQIASLQVKYETEKKEKEIALLNKDKKIKELNLEHQELLLQKRNMQLWTLGGLFVFSALVAYLLYNRARLRQEKLRAQAVLEAEYRERKRIGQDMHDELGSGLSKIVIMAGIAQSNVNGNRQFHENIHTISKAAKDLVDNMSSLIWTLSPENNSLDNLVTRLREHASDYLDELSLTYRLDFPEHIPDIRISGNVQRNVFLTFKEALNNAVKHAEANQLSVEMKLADNRLDLKIADNGKGFKTEAVKKNGHGLYNMRQRMGSIKGDFVIRSEEGRGTEVNICVPLTMAVV